MRIENFQSPQAVTPKLEKFLTECLGGVAIDDIHDPQATRIDFSCLRGLLAVEIKSLEGPPQERIENYVDTLRKKPDFPAVFEEVTLTTLANRMSDPEKVMSDALGRIGRTIVTHLKKAENQLLAHTSTFPRKNVLRMVILVNEDHAEYDPDSVLKIVSREMNRQENNTFRYENVDAVWYITERHATVINGRVVQPILTMTGPGIRHCEWKPNLIDFIVRKWSVFNAADFIEDAAETNAYVATEHVPETMKRHEMWALNYRRDPYFRPLPDARIKEIFEEIMLISRLYTLRGTPIKMDMDKFMENMAHFTHIREEMKSRGILFTDIPINLEHEIAAARRIKLPEIVIEWLINFKTPAP